MTTDPVWLVTGETGDYSDRNEWPFGWYADEATAQAVVEKLNTACVGLGKGYDDRRRTQAKMRAEVDSLFSVDYTGTEYCVREVKRGPTADEVAERLSRVFPQVREGS